MTPIPARNWKTALAGLLPAIAAIAYALGGYYTGHLDGPTAIGIVTVALGLGAVGGVAKDADADADKPSE